MSKDLQNPNAFPCVDAQGFNSIGMSLRDYFAAQAIVGMSLTGSGYGKDEVPWFDIVAKRAYELADAMLKARDQ
jgi:hypothetical protein